MFGHKRNNRFFRFFHNIVCISLIQIIENATYLIQNISTCLQSLYSVIKGWSFRIISNSRYLLSLLLKTCLKRRQIMLGLYFIKLDCIIKRSFITKKRIIVSY